MSDLLGFNDLLKAGSSSFNKKYRMVSDDVEERDYGAEIPVAKDVETGEIITVPHNGKTRVLTVAKSGQGKTVLGKAYLSRIVDKGGNVFCGTDIKNDFQSFNYKDGPSKSLQEYTAGLLPGEKKKIERLQGEEKFKQHFDRRLGIPYFLKDKYSSNPRAYADLFGIGFNDVKEQDLKYLIGFDSWSSAQKDIFDDILLDAGNTVLSWNFLEDRLKDEGRSGEKIWTKLRRFKDKGVITSKGDSLNSFLDFSDVGLVSLGLKGMDDFRLGGEENIRFYSALAHRKVIEKVEDGEISTPFVLYDDEVHEMAPASDDSPVTEELSIAFSRKGRQAGISSWLSTQEPHKIPSEHDKSPHQFISMTSHAFIGKGVTWKGYRTVFQAFSFYNSNDTQPLRDLTNSLGDGEFLYCDESMDTVRDVRKVRPLSPLVAHPEG
jgi:hypothetical protein